MQPVLVLLNHFLVRQFCCKSNMGLILLGLISALISDFKAAFDMNVQLVYMVNDSNGYLTHTRMKSPHKNIPYLKNPPRKCIGITITKSLFLF